MSYEIEHLYDNAEVEFSGSKLALNADKEQYGKVGSKKEGENEMIMPNGNDSDSNFNATTGGANNNFPQRSVMHSQSPEIPSSEDAKSYFAVRSGAFENAVADCKSILLQNLDGDLLGAWLLTEIDHWDKEKERIVFLTNHSFILIKYDLIALHLLEYKRIFLKDVDRVVTGELKYPQGSLVPTRNVFGIRILWNKGRPLSFTQSWNPWCQDIPWATLTSHPLAWYKDRESGAYMVETFSKDFAQVLSNEMDSREAGEIIEKKPIVIKNYIGLASAFHNANNLGFFKNRGRLSF